MSGQPQRAEINNTLRQAPHLARHPGGINTSILSHRAAPWTVSLSKHHRRHAESAGAPHYGAIPLLDDPL
jgi:hypothetical protein